MAVVETTTFRLAAGVDDEAFLVADRAVQTEFIPNLGGFLRRTTCRSRGGEWLVITLWQSEKDAQHCTALSATSPVVERFSSLLEAGSLVTKVFSTLD